MPLTTNPEDSRTPPGFAAAVVHHTPHQLFATLVCHSVTAKLNRLQLLAQADQQPANDVQAHCQHPACIRHQACTCVGS